ncbi:MAG TPA: hypothetical protein VFO18_17335 [Methylomirabilota bacterium]|nr:hypothetical protein [Methylomirabilota bacterium]
MRRFALLLMLAAGVLLAPALAAIPGFLLFGPGQPRPSQDSQEDRIPAKVG